MENGHGDRYRYDDEGQLVKAWYDASDPVNSGAGNSRYDGFNYDALGNRAGANFIANHGAMIFTRKDNGLNQYRGWWNFSVTNYDDDIAGWGSPQHANGVLMQHGNMTAGFNALNQPMMVYSAGTAPNWMFFGYDPLGRCVKRWTGALSANGSVPPPTSNPATAVYLYYDGGNLIQETPASGGVLWNGSSPVSAPQGATQVYIHGARVDEIVFSANFAAWQFAYHHYDANGNCTLLTDTGGGIAEQYEYDAFGQPYFFNAGGSEFPSSQWNNRFLFTGREYLSELKLYDYRNRMYQPELGRFMQPDPTHFEAGDYNLYRYCHNDPVNKSDPYGENWLDNVQMALDVAGFVPGIGEFADAASGLISAGRGDWTGAALSAAAMIPTGGQVAGAAKIIRRGEAAVKRAENLAKGIPASQLGPSGKPKIHTVEKATDKRAQDAARQAGDQKPIKDTQDKGQGPHYHAVDKDGKKLEGKDNIHFKKRGD